jgi:TusA-related sulfurtransferase
MRIDLQDLGLDSGGDLLLRRALRQLTEGEQLDVAGHHEELELHLRTWCRALGHRFDAATASDGDRRGTITPAAHFGKLPTERAGDARAAGVADRAPPHWGLAGRGAEVELGGPQFDFGLVDKLDLWTDDAARLYARAAAAQWDPERAIDWAAPIEHDSEIEDAIVQIMTYLIENETAALLVPARFLARLHPHFREVMQVLAIQAADEARHIEVFTRRALLKRDALGLSTIGGQASLKTLLDEPDFALASFLLSVMGEGSFLVLLNFIYRYAPDPVTRSVARLAAQDEARHVAFGLAHLRRQAAQDAALLPRLSGAVHRRHAELAETAGLNQQVFEALTILAAGGFSPHQIRSGHARVMQLQHDMDDARRGSLVRLGFSAAEAQALSQLHTRNFM